MQLAINKSLGHFGDRRLDKGGRRFSRRSFARAVFANAKRQRESGVIRCAFGVS
jgi:hypothetical protein